MALELPRWQNFMALVTTIMSVLVVDVWFYYSKSLNCCIQIRTLLGCDPSYLAPCREFVGNCGDTEAQFASLQDSGIPADYVCTAFPDEASPRDKIVVGLICVAVAIPFTYIIGEVLAASNVAEPEGQLSWKGPQKGLFLKFKEEWDWRRSRPWLPHVQAAAWAHEGLGKAAFGFFMEAIAEPLYARLCGGEEEKVEEEKEEKEERKEAEPPRTPAVGSPLSVSSPSGGRVAPLTPPRRAGEGDEEAWRRDPLGPPRASEVDKQLKAVNLARPLPAAPCPTV